MKQLESYSMGNVLDVAKGAGDTYTEDLKWLGIQNSAIFNDAYVSEIYQSLPAFEGTEIVEVIFLQCNLPVIILNISRRKKKIRN